MSKGSRKAGPPIETLAEAREKANRIAKRFGTTLAPRATTNPAPMTPRAALRAIKARISGEWDAPELVALGPLLPDRIEDILRILAAVEAEGPAE